MSLSNKLTFSVLALLAIGFIFLSTLFYLSLSNFGERFLKNGLLEKTKIISKVYSEPLWNFDKVQIAEISNSLLSNNDIASIVAIKVENSDGEILFEKIHHEVSVKEFSSFHNLSNTKIQKVEVSKNEQNIGNVIFVVSNEQFFQKLKSQVTYIFMTSTVMLFLVGFWVNFSLQNLLLRPIEHIMKHIKGFEIKDNFEIYHYPAMSHEFETIGGTLNKISMLLEKRSLELKVYADNLEELVVEKTKDLQEQIAVNINSARLVAVGEIAASIAHEVNNPLTVIELQITKLKRRFNDLGLDGEELKIIEKIQSMAIRISKIVKGLKSISRDGNNDVMKKFQLEKLIDDVSILVEMKAKDSEVHLQIINELKNKELFGREVQISQVIVNLINNSIDAITSKTGERWIRLETAEKSDFIEFKITDSGLGIPDDLQKKIMQPFFTTKDADKGTGLGLSISKKIIEEHGGVFYYNSESKNTQFVFTVKLGEKS